MYLSPYRLLSILCRKAHILYAINEFIIFCCLHCKYTIAGHDISILFWTMYCSNIMHAHIHSITVPDKILVKIITSFVRSSNVICIHCMQQHRHFGSYWHFTCTYINNASTNTFKHVCPIPGYFQLKDYSLKYSINYLHTYYCNIYCMYYFGHIENVP